MVGARESLDPFKETSNTRSAFPHSDLHVKELHGPGELPIAPEPKWGPMWGKYQPRAQQMSVCMLPCTAGGGSGAGGRV